MRAGSSPSSLAYYLDGVKTALKKGANVNTKGQYGWTGLMEAARNNHNSVVGLLLKTPNIDVNLKDKRGISALHHAVKSKNIEGLKLLLNFPTIDVNFVDPDYGSTLVS